MILKACLALLLASQAGAFQRSQAAVTPDPLHSKPEHKDLWPHIDLEEARRLHAQPGVLFVDGRAYADWEKSRIPGAVALPVGEFDKSYPRHKAGLRRAKVAVIYCQGENCGSADYLAGLLADKGHRNIAVFWGGYPAWKKAKLPLEAGRAVNKKN